MISVAVVQLGDSREAQLADQLGCELLEPNQSGDTNFLLSYESGVLSLRATEFPEFTPFSVDYTTMSVRNRCMDHKLSSDPLIKAVGKPDGKLLDATMGWGMDAFALSAFGWNVEAFDRSTIVCQMVGDALKRCFETKEKGFSVFCLDSSTRLLEESALYGAIYLDPMFPGDGKQAKRKKELILLGMLAGRPSGHGGFAK